MKNPLILHYQRHFILLLSIGFLGLVAVCAPGYAAQKTDPAKEAGFTPHKALYNIQLAGTKSGSQIANISGQMFYEWQSGCDAWLSNHRFNLLYEYADSPAMKVTSDFSIYEPFDQKSMSFTSQRKRDGQLFEELRGQAIIHEDGQGEASYTKPKDLVFELPEGTLFPMAHTLNLFKQLKKGKKFYKATIFDGSDEDGPVEVNAFMGKPANAMAGIEASPDIDMSLANTPAHKIRLAFFPLNDQSETADYEMTITLHENGVISDMLVEYDDFSVTQKLTALEAMNIPCEDVQIQN